MAFPVFRRSFGSLLTRGSLLESVHSTRTYVNVSAYFKRSTFSSYKSPTRDLLRQSRCFHTNQDRNSKSYDPDGKTTVSVLNKEPGAPLMVNAYSQDGFRLNNGMKVLGAVVLFPKTVLSWNVGRADDVTPESLALFSILVPKPDVLVIGVGDKGTQLPLDSVRFLRQKKINIEVLSTEHACTTFNFLAGEGRCVVAMLIPPTHIIWTETDLANTKRDKKRLYDENEQS